MDKNIIEVPMDSSTTGTLFFLNPNSSWRRQPSLPLRKRFNNKLIQVSIKCMSCIGLRFATIDGFTSHESSMNTYQFLAYEALHVHTDDSPSHDMHGMAVLAFTRLHHLNLHGFEVELEAKLASLSEGHAPDQADLEKLRSLLRDYCQAIQDYEYISQAQFKPPRGHELYPLYETLLPTLYARLRKHPDNSNFRPEACEDNLYRTIMTPHRSFATKVLCAIIGALVLIMLMMVMTLRPNVRTSLVTSSVLIAVVAVGIILLSDGTWRDVLGMTVPYAAVLVVFVGTSTAGQNKSLRRQR
ncbi:hypothetical protein EK21DRAFT_114516 [Setomelanomma holmii]|uniref:Uncharacterized protein n=1 Tax=Setomelanomma holmii TaxID=210430 RepID=A0A9P4H6V0_9PLEO|nr:hypothetical protein EK21DRAFT_114516 [Setomelanomma holmii]